MANSMRKYVVCCLLHFFKFTTHGYLHSRKAECSRHSHRSKLHYFGRMPGRPSLRLSHSLFSYLILTVPDLNCSYVITGKGSGTFLSRSPASCEELCTNL
jgi:hypothetical protein